MVFLYRSSAFFSALFSAGTYIGCGIIIERGRTSTRNADVVGAGGTRFREGIPRWTATGWMRMMMVVWRIQNDVRNQSGDT